MRSQLASPGTCTHVHIPTHRIKNKDKANKQNKTKKKKKTKKNPKLYLKKLRNLDVRLAEVRRVGKLVPLFI
jgi:hypothetical protein